jgi:hypothetical protein
MNPREVHFSSIGSASSTIYSVQVHSERKSRVREMAPLHRHILIKPRSVPRHPTRYTIHTTNALQQIQRLRENQQNAQLMRNPQMMAGQNQFAGMRQMRNGMAGNDMRAAAMSKHMFV